MKDAQAAKTAFDYSASRAYAASLGMPWREDWLPVTDATFVGLDLSQAQVDGVMRLHIAVVKHLFSPSVYRFRDRLKIALFFLCHR